MRDYKDMANLMAIIARIMQCLFFESMNNPIFFKSLPQQEPWYKLYNLLRDSTFYFQNEKGKYIKYSIPFGDTYWLFGVRIV